VAHITGHVRIAAPLEQVFDTVADSRNESSFNTVVTDVELLTPQDLGLVVDLGGLDAAASTSFPPLDGGCALPGTGRWPGATR
jgi:hypothetical protein